MCHGAKACNSNRLFNCCYILDGIQHCPKDGMAPLGSPSLALLTHRLRQQGLAPFDEIDGKGFEGKGRMPVRAEKNRGRHF